MSYSVKRYSELQWCRSLGLAFAIFNYHPVLYSGMRTKINRFPLTFGSFVNSKESSSRIPRRVRIREPVIGSPRATVNTFADCFHNISGVNHSNNLLANVRGSLFYPYG